MRRTCYQGALFVLTVLLWSVVAVCAAEAQQIQANRGVSIEPDAAAALVSRDQISRSSTNALDSSEIVQSPSGIIGDSQQALTGTTAGTNTPPVEAEAQAVGVATESSPAAKSLPLPLAAQERLPLGRSPDNDAPMLGENTDGSETNTIGGSQWLLSTAAALAIVIGLIYVAKLGFQRLSGVSGVTGHAPGLVEVLARTSIGPKSSVMFLRIGQRVIVVAQSGAGLQTLSEIDDPDEVADLIGQVQAAKPKSISNGFRSLLGRFDNQFEGDVAMPETELEANWDEESEGQNGSEHAFDRTRNELSQLRSRIRLLKAPKA